MTTVTAIAQIFLTAFNTFSAPVLVPKDASFLTKQQAWMDCVNLYNPELISFSISQNSQNSNFSVEATSSLGFLLKYSPSWQRYTTQSSNQTSDILLARSFPSPKGEILVKVTTTAINFLGVPKNLPKTVKKINISADFFAKVLTQSGYKIFQVTEVMINEKAAIKLVAETPQKLGSTIVLLEGKGETLVVSTAVYPIDSSKISREILEQVVTEIGLVQNSITIPR